MTKLSVVCPVYNESESIEHFVIELKAVLLQLTDDFEIILCVDPSTDATEVVIENLNSRDNRVKMLRFSRKVGQDLATLAGLTKSRGEAVIVMDCDFQDPPQVIVDFFHKWQQGASVVFGKRASRNHDNFVKKTLSSIFYRVMEGNSKFSIRGNIGDFRLLDRRVVNEVIKHDNHSFFLRAVTPVVGFRHESVEFDREERVFGKTKYNSVLGGVHAALTALFSYTTFTQRIFFLSGLFSFALGTVLSFLSTGWLTGLDDRKFFVLSLLSLFSFLITFLSFASWILVSFLNRIYMESREIPPYVVENELGWEA